MEEELAAPGPPTSLDLALERHAERRRRRYDRLYELAYGSGAIRSGGECGLLESTAVTLSAEEAAYLAGRLRKLFSHFGCELPAFAESDSSLLLIAGSCIGGLFANIAADQDELTAAAQAVVDRWDSPLWKIQPHTGEFINRLRAALKACQGH